MCAALVFFDAADFRAQFPPYADALVYPDAMLQGNWDSATLIISNEVYGCDIFGFNGRARVLYLLTAHITYISDLINAGETPSIETSATIDKISVSTMAPPVKNQFDYWLYLSPYGQQVLALLKIKSVGGFYVGGLPERKAFRKVYGTFN